MHRFSRSLLVPALLLAATACGQRPAPLPEPASEPLSATATAAIPDVRPDAPLTRAQRRWVDSTLASLSPRERVGQMVHVWVLGDYTHVDHPSFREVREWIEQDGVGGVLMSLGSPIEVASKIAAMQRLAKVPLLVSSDLEPGLGRLEGGLWIPYLMTGGSATIFPNNMAIAATGRDTNAVLVGEIIGREARAIGIHIGFAPTVDVNNNPANPVINVRSFGEDPAEVARLSSAFTRGMQRSGLAATAKHFPGHGDTDVDTHHALATVKSDRERLNVVELVPFRAAIASGVAGIMTAHIALPAVNDSTTPATLAPRIITDLLRDSLGFRGVTFTDAMSMEGIGQGYDVARSAVLAVQAGADVLTKPTDTRKAIDAVMAAVERGEITQERIDRSVRRLLEMKVRSGVVTQPMPDLRRVRAVVGSPEHWEVSNRIAGEAVTLLKDADSLLPVSRSHSVAVVSYAPEIEVMAGRAFGAEVRAAIPNARVVRLTQRSAGAELDSLAAALAGMDRVIVTTHVRTIEGEGRNAIPAHINAWIDSLASRTKVIVVAHHNPYVIRHFPRVRSYVATFGMQETLERAAARAVTGQAPFRGRSPVSLPGIFARGDGIQRAVSAAAGSAP